ncbi:retrovirus-related pol polyprotein from transposon TNT 1-94 [Tanacetum coccineum]
MTGNKAYLVEYQDYNGGHMCDKKNKVLFTYTECLVLSPDFKLPDENQVLLRVPKQNNMYSFNLENIVPTGGLACLIAKATVDESNKWHRRLGHEFKNQGTIIEFCGSKGIKREYSNARTPQQNGVAKRKNKTLIEATRTMLADSFLPNTFWAEAVSTACYVFNRVLVTKPQNKTPYELITGKIPIISYIRPFGCQVTILNTIDHLGKFEEKYDEGFLVGADDLHKSFKEQGIVDSRCSRHPWTVNKHTLLNIKIMVGPVAFGVVKIYLSDAVTRRKEFKNMDIIELCGSKGIKREYSNARTPQQNGVAERKNKTLIEATRTMLADSFLPNTFWAEAVSTACYVLNRVLVTKPQNKTPYELITGKIPIISYIRPFGCHVTILNTIDHLGKFEEKSDKGFLVGYSLNSKAFRVYNLETKRVEENLYINFLENKPNVAGKGPNWLFDLDYLTDSMNYQPVTAENKANKTACPKEANHSADGLLYSNSQEAQSQYGDIEPKKISQALEDESWVDAMQEELFASNYGTIDEEVYVSQPLGFVDPKFPKKVEQVGKSSLYGLHQAPRAWYATLSTFLLKSGYRRGTIDNTLFIKKDKNDIMLVQILDEFYRRAHLSFLDKVKQKEDGIFISQVQVLLTSKSSHLHAVKKVFSKILTGKSTTGGCQISAGDLFYGSCKKQTNLWILLPQRQSSCRLQMLWASIGDSESNVFRLWTKLSTARPKLSTDSTKIESMKLEAMVEERRIFKCWFHYHTTNGYQFTMSNRLKNWLALAIPDQMTTGKERSNPFMAGSLPKTTWPT